MIRLLLPALVLMAAATHAEGREANHLKGADSPYLLQHLDNPVEWYPWGPEALDRARRENKPIFVSVGYSSCHWCHVMEEESFEDEAIAALLNEHFVSIKIDRESRPDLDEQFMVVTELLTGGGGWPNSVFLTPSGDPVFAGGYFPPEAFREAALQVGEAWRTDPAAVEAEARRIASAVARFLTQKAEAREVTPDAIGSAVGTILAETDNFNGGYGVAPKFPREPLFLFLLDHAERTGDPEALRAVTDMLDGMIRGGVHDHVGGGFHRYAIDPEWRVPHFEKMLYTQALTGRLLVRAWSITGEPRYRRAAERTFDHVLRDMRSPDGAFFSALDASSPDAAGERTEGAFYTWTLPELDALGDDAAFIREVFPVTAEGDLDGANVLALGDPLSGTAARLGLTEAALAEELDRVLARMDAVRRARTPPRLDRKVVASWNALMIETLAEAAFRLGRPEYHDAAAAAARFILTRMKEGGALSRIWFEGSASTPAQLPDHAALGLAMIALHDFAPADRPAQGWLGEAEALAQAVRLRFGPADDGLRMTETEDGLGTVIPVDDTEIPSGNALALSLFARLSGRAAVPDVERDGFRLAGALSGLALDRPEQRGEALRAIREMQDGETGPVRHAAKGAVRVILTADRDTGEIVADIRIAEGWHINAHRPLDDYFVATTLAVEGMPDLPIRYPDAVTRTLRFNDTPLALYEGDARIAASGILGRGPDGPARAVLTLQACSETICLQPEELVFILW